MGTIFFLSLSPFCSAMTIAYYYHYAYDSYGYVYWCVLAYFSITSSLRYIDGKYSYQYCAKITLTHDGPEDEIIILYWVWLGASILLVRLLSDLIVHTARSHLIVYRFGDDDMCSEKISMAFALFRPDSLSIRSIRFHSIQPFHDDTMRVCGLD